MRARCDITPNQWKTSSAKARIGQEAMEGARAGSALRETKCQTLENSGGAAVKIPTPTSVCKVSATANSIGEYIPTQWGDSCVRLDRLLLYSDFSTGQHPASLRSELWFSWQSPSLGQSRNSNPVMTSSWQCAETGSQRKAARANTMFWNRRTRY